MQLHVPFQRRDRGRTDTDREKTQERRRQCDCGGRNWNNRATSQRTTEDTRTWKRPSKDCALESSEGAQPYDTALLSSVPSSHKNITLGQIKIFVLIKSLILSKGTFITNLNSVKIPKFLIAKVTVRFIEENKQE